MIYGAVLRVEKFFAESVSQGIDTFSTLIHQKLGIVSVLRNKGVVAWHKRAVDCFGKNREKGIIEQ